MVMDYYAYWNGGQIRDLFEALVSICSGSSYEGLLKTAVLAGFLVTLTGALLKWQGLASKVYLFAAVLFYSVMLVPKVDVAIHDERSADVYVVSNVPFGVGFFASATSKIGHFLTESFETAFSLPDAERFSKFGLVYPGLGWVCWKGKEYLPEEMSFSVNYLGANITQVGLNFSRPAAQILGQYYQFIRLGFQGYKEVQYNSLTIAKYIHDEIGKMAPFVNYSDEVVNPLFIWYLKPEYARAAKWTLYDLQDKLSQHGWMVPAYTLPSKLEDYVVMRVVVRQGFSRDMADMLLGDIKNAITELEKLDYPTPTRMAQEKNLPVETKIFNHGCRTHKK